MNDTIKPANEAAAALLTELRRWAGDGTGYAACMIRSAANEIERLAAQLAPSANMSQPTTPNTVDDFLPLPAPAFESRARGGLLSEDGYTLAQVHAAILADRAQRTVAASEPVGYMRKWAFDKEEPYKEKNGNGRMAWAGKFRFQEVTKGRIFADDVPLFAGSAKSPNEDLNERMLNLVRDAAGDAPLRYLQKEACAILDAHPAPTAAVSVDSPEFHEKLHAYRNSTFDFAETKAALIAHINALINQAAQKGNAK